MTTHTSSLVFLQYLTTVFDNIQDSILLIGLEPQGVYRLLLANKPFFRTSGFPQDSLGKTVPEIVGEEPAKYLIRHYKTVIRTKKPLEYTRWSDVPTGRKAFEVQLIPILNTVGEVVQIAALTRDVTEVLELREQVAKLTGQAPAV